jgi:hypothetical protein
VFTGGYDLSPYMQQIRFVPVAYPGILFGGGVQQIQFRTEDRENGDLGAFAPLVSSPGGSCNLVQEMSFHIVKCS